MLECSLKTYYTYVLKVFLFKKLKCRKGKYKHKKSLFLALKEQNY